MSTMHPQKKLTHELIAIKKKKKTLELVLWMSNAKTINYFTTF